MKFGIICLIVIILQVGSAICLLDVMGIGAAISAIGYAGYSYFQCFSGKCCSDQYMKKDLNSFHRMLNDDLYGQHIAQKIIFSAVAGHLAQENPKKPLVMSFHGVSGSGKTYVVQMLAKSMYKEGELSSFYHFYNGRSDFPRKDQVPVYQLKTPDLHLSLCYQLNSAVQLIVGHTNQLKQEILQSLEACEQSIFVFDEVQLMPEGLLDILVPFIDYTDTSFSSKKIKKNKSIFMFLSNTGSMLIVQKMVDLWVSGKKREDLTILDFETLVAKGAFNEVGGFHKSETIETSLIDHYVPFLPLEESHVIRCIKYAFRNQGVMNPLDNDIKDILSHVTWGPEPHVIYSNAGCKRIEQKVTTTIFLTKYEV